MSFLIYPVNCEDEVHPNARISWLPRREVSQGGGVITIFGNNFAADNFNQFEPDLGNRVSEISYMKTESAFNASKIALMVVWSAIEVIKTWKQNSGFILRR